MCVCMCVCVCGLCGLCYERNKVDLVERITAKTFVFSTPDSHHLHSFALLTKQLCGVCLSVSERACG